MKNNKNEYFAINFLRESLRCQADENAKRLSRSVARLTSCDELPCLEYGEEVRSEQRLAERLFYLQHCRDAVERCIGSGGARLRYRWADGTLTHTRFRRVDHGRIQVKGFDRDHE
jgi:hypothetical protein